MKNNYLLFLLTPLCVSGLGTRIVLFSMLRYYRNHSQRNGRISVLLTLLSWLFTCFPHVHLRLQIAFTLSFHSSYLPSVPLCLPPLSLWLGLPFA